MKRRRLLQFAAAALGSAPFLPYRLFAASSVRRRCRPADPGWPSKAAWDALNRSTGGNLMRVSSPLSACETAPGSSACDAAFASLRNPYFIGGQPGATQTLGWVDAWRSSPSAYAVAARDAQDVAAAVNFARERNLRLVVKGGGHSYLGTSNAPDSLLIWTRHMNEVSLGNDSVTLGAGCIWMHAYEAVTTKAGRYVQGGGCTTVGVAGLIQSGGFGSFSKHYGTAASGLLEAEVVTADGSIRIANATSNPDLFWALKGGGGGSFGVVTKVTLAVRDAPDWFGVASFQVKASSDAAYKTLLAHFVDFYREHLFDDRWGEQAEMRPDNTLSISMVSCGLSAADANALWKPFLDWLQARPGDYTLAGPPIIVSGPPRIWWDADFLQKHFPGVVVPNGVPGARPGEFWWSGDADQVGQYLNAYESLWLPASLLEDSARLGDAFFAASRSYGFSLHFNKGLAGAPDEAIGRARDTATNPSVLDAFALAISASSQPPSYPGIAGHEPDVAKGRLRARAIHAGMDELRALAPDGGSYLSESDFFDADWKRAYWGSNYARLAKVKAAYDPDGLFFVHHGVGSEQWSADGFTRL